MRFRGIAAVGVIILSGTLVATALPLSYAIGVNSAVSANTDAEHGLVIRTELDPGLSNVAFTLDDMDHATFEFFDIWTPERWVNSDDQEAKPIKAYLDFEMPKEMVVLNGVTEGKTIFCGLFQRGQVSWSGPALVKTDRGEFEVSLNDACFNWGIFGLTPGERFGADIRASVKQTESHAPTDPPLPVPDGGMTMMLLGFGITVLGFLRRK